MIGNAASLISNLELIKAGTSILRSDSQSKLDGLSGEATKIISGMDKKGVARKLAATASSKQIGGIVKLVSSAL